MWSLLGNKYFLILIWFTCEHKLPQVQKPFSHNKNMHSYTLYERALINKLPTSSFYCRLAAWFLFNLTNPPAFVAIVRRYSTFTKQLWTKKKKNVKKTNKQVHNRYSIWKKLPVFFFFCNALFLGGSHCQPQHHKLTEERRNQWMECIFFQGSLILYIQHWQSEQPQHRQMNTQMHTHARTVNKCSLQGS